MPVVAEVVLRGITRDQYDAVRAEAGWLTDPPSGRWSHCTWWVRDECHTIDVWESESALESFTQRRLTPAMARAGVKVAVETTFHRPHEVCILQTVTVAATAPVQVPPTDNVGIVRSVYEAWARGDIAAVLALVDEGATWTVPETVVFGGTYLGPGKVGIFFAKLHESYREVRAEPLSYVGAGDTVSVVGRYRGVARSGTAVEVPFVHIWTMAKGRATSFTETLDTAKVNTALATPAPSIDLTTPAPTRVST